MNTTTTTAFELAHKDHDVRRIHRTDGTNTTYLYCVPCRATKDEAPAPARCATHPAFDANYCPSCGTAREMGRA